MNRPIHFEFSAADTKRAQDFYSTVFGWQFSKWDGPIPYWLITTGDDATGINGGMMPRQEDSFAGSVNTVGVASLDESIATVEKNGGRIAMPKMPIPGMGWLAYCSDTEGNIFGMMQPDPNAK